MNWEAISAIGEIASAAAVIATLIYFALQIKQYATGLQSATFHATMQEFNQINVAQLDPALADLLERGMNDLASLELTERYQFSWILRTYVNIWENMYQQFLQNACPETYWLPYAKQAKAIFDTPGGKIFREGNTLNQQLFGYLDSLPESNRDFDLLLERRGESPSD